MLNKLNEKTKLDIFITSTATLLSVFFITLSYIWEDYSTQILSILIIVLPTIYIIGNLIIRGLLEKEYEDAMIEINEGIEEMEDDLRELDNLEDENEALYKDLFDLEKENNKLKDKIKKLKG